MEFFVFFLGQTRELCWEELQVVCERLQLPVPQLITDGVAVLETSATPDLAAMQEILGGTVKIAVGIQKTEILDQAALENTVEEILIQSATKRFAIAEHGRDQQPRLEGVTLKKRLQAQKQSASYYDAPRDGVNAAALKNRHVYELHVIQTENAMLFAQTQTWQDIDAWTERDIEKPHRDRQRGMLAPKVARMMLNLAIGADSPDEHIILDPFCGMGTLLIEGSDLGVTTLLGNDLSREAIMATDANLRWWKKHSNQNFDYVLAAKPAEKLDLTDFDMKRPTAIVTEPFLGKLTPKTEQIPGIVRGLEKLYRGSLRSFARLLKPGQRVVIIFPAFTGKKGKTITVDHVLHDLPELGFKMLGGPWRGGRPSAYTQRHIYVLEYEPYVTR